MTEFFKWHLPDFFSRNLGGTRPPCPPSPTPMERAFFLAHSKHELIQWRGVRRLSVCKLLRKSLLLAGKWPDRHQTCTRWTPGQRASRVCSRSRSRSKVTWYAHFLGFLEWATPSSTVWLWNCDCAVVQNVQWHRSLRTSRWTGLYVCASRAYRRPQRDVVRTQRQPYIYLQTSQARWVLGW